MDSIQSYCGIDLHKLSLTVTVVNREGERIALETIPTKCVGRIRRFVGRLPGPVACAIESVGMYRWLWDLLKPLCGKLVLADATELAWRRGRRRPKTDPKDAEHLAGLLRDGTVPAAYVPEGPEYDLRRLGRHWHGHSRLAARLKVRLRSLLNQANQRGPKNLDGPAVRRWLLAHGNALDETAHLCAEDLLETIEHVELQQFQRKRRMQAICRRHFPALTELLKSVPGIADVLAAVLIGEIGSFERFDTAEAFACYTGLTRRVHESAGRIAATGISRAGSATLRWALYEAATTLCRCDRHWKTCYDALAEKMGSKKKARTAAARKLASCLFGMAKTGECFRRGPSTHPTRAANRARLLARPEAA